VASALPPLYAHRLGRHYGPDSSATALERTLSGPVEGLETDVCLTADGGLVLLHDPLLPLGTTLDGWARDRSVAEIRSAWLLGSAGEPTADHPLELDDLLRRTPDGIGLQLEVKAHADRLLAVRTAEALCQRLSKQPDLGRVEVISFHGEACAVAAAHGIETRLVIWADYAPEALAAWALQTGVGGVSIEHFMLTERLVGVLRDAGLSVNVGTVNHHQLLPRVLEHSPDAIGTDRPHELRAEAEDPAAASYEACPAVRR
jgi:glycerophosphoryl diester phosphodiesterase